MYVVYNYSIILAGGLILQQLITTTEPQPKAAIQQQPQGTGHTSLLEIFILSDFISTN